MMETLIHSSHQHALSHRPKQPPRQQQHPAGSKTQLREMRARQRDIETFGEDALAGLKPATAKPHQHQHATRSQGPVASPSTPSKGRNAARKTAHTRNHSSSQESGEDVGNDSISGPAQSHGKKAASKGRSNHKAPSQPLAMHATSNADDSNSRKVKPNSPAAAFAQAYPNPYAHQQQPSAAPATPIRIPHGSATSSPSFISLSALSGASAPTSASGSSGLAYAGPRFHNSPSPADLPLPKFGAKKAGNAASGLFSSSPSTGSFGMS